MWFQDCVEWLSVTTENADSVLSLRYQHVGYMTNMPEFHPERSGHKGKVGSFLCLF